MASRSPSFIDLTLEPDSPEVQPRSIGNGSGSGSSRRSQPQPGQAVEVIDLTETVDDDDDTPIVSGSRTLPGRAAAGSGPGWMERQARQLFGSGGSMAQGQNQNARGHPFLRLPPGFNGYSVGGLEGLARFTNNALDSVPSLRSDIGGTMHGMMGGGIGSGGIDRRRPARQTAWGGARHAAGGGASGSSGAAGGFGASRAGAAGGGNSGVRGPDVFFGASDADSLLNPLGGNQPDLNYENNAGLFADYHRGYPQQRQLQQHQHYAAQLAERARAAPNARAQRHPRHLHLDMAANMAEALAANMAELARMEALPGMRRMDAEILSILDADKPPYVPPTEAPAGFSRSTGEDLVAVCSSCDEELAYDSNQGGDAKDGSATAASTSKRKPTRKEREEHPFWAVTGCGHVYCRRCFDNRRNAIKGDKLPAVDFKTDGKSVFCAAEDCNVDVTAKKAWIGLFV